MTINEAKRYAADSLRAARVPDPEMDARLMLCAVTGLDRTALLLGAQSQLTPQQEQRLSSLLLSRTQREPLQYLLGTQGFYGLDIAVDSRALIPRQETETLCETGLVFLRGKAAPAVLDLCTGSGAIAVAVKHERPDAAVVATDYSADALALAQHNASRLGADVRFLRGDLLAPVAGERFDLILSNPPYVRSADCDSLQPEVRREPRMALDGGADGLDFYRRIALDAPGCLKPGGMLAVEVGDGQATAVAALFEAAGLCDISVIQDLYGVERVVAARMSGTPT